MIAGTVSYNTKVEKEGKQMMYGGFYGSTFDLDRDGELNDFESFLDFSIFMDEEEARERREAAEWDDDYDDYDDF
jgi:hypothetical protein